MDELINLSQETKSYLLRVLKEKRENDENLIEELEWRARMAPVSRQVADDLIKTYKDEIQKTDQAIQEIAY